VACVFAGCLSDLLRKGKPAERFGPSYMQDSTLTMFCELKQRRRKIGDLDWAAKLIDKKGDIGAAIDHIIDQLLVDAWPAAAIDQRCAYKERLWMGQSNAPLRLGLCPAILAHWRCRIGFSVAADLFAIEHGVA
jgi:hypothetical protein